MRPYRGKAVNATAIGLILSLIPLQVLAQDTRKKLVEETDESAGASENLGTIILDGSGRPAAETSYLSGTAIGRVKTDPKKLPATVSSYTAKRIEEQNIRSNLDLMQGTPGVDVTSNEGFFRVRGFSAQTAVDGISVGSFVGRTSADLTAFEQVEILKGPAALFQGNGSPGGTVNYSFKRPGETESFTGALGIGDPDSKLVTLDYTLAPMLDGRLRARFVGSFEDRDLFTRPESIRRSSLYGVTEFDITERTTLRVGFWQQKNNSNQTFRTGLPTWNDGTLIDFPVETTASQDWNEFRFTARWLNIDLEHEFNEVWSAKLSYRRGKSYHPSVYGSMFGGRGQAPAGCAGVTGYGSGIVPNTAVGWACFTAEFWSDINEVEAWDGSVTGAFEAFGQTHDVVFGLTHERSWFGRELGSATDPGFGYVLDIFDPDHHVTGRPAMTLGAPYEKGRPSEKYNLFAQVTVNVNERLRFPVSGRLTWLKTSAGDWTANGEFTPSLGVVYDVTDQITVYGQYARMFTANTSNRSWDPSWTPGVPRDPTEGILLPNVTGSQKEIGIKADLFGGQALATASIFEIIEENRAMRDPESEPGGDHPPIGTSTFMVATGEQRTRGLELGLSGEIRPGWSVGIGYAYLDAKITKHDTLAGVDVGTARHSGNIWTNYAFEGGKLDGLSIGGGVRFSSDFKGSTTDANDTNRVHAPGYAVVSARVGYKINDTFSASLNIDNLLDRKYYEIVSSRGGSNYYGESRRVSLNIKATF